tara:strand:- start:693 stop:2252 length:1560 start_codon:yes stop_codon:yes gene_type:complete
MKSKITLNKEILFIIFLFLFSLIVNQFYGNKGIYPVDSFSHFDTGYRVLLGEYPFKDFWIISGPIIDYIQALFFYFFGTNWQAYVLHASFINGIVTITTFIVLRNFKLNIYYSIIYSLFFSLLAYPSSGTPFVDHHSAFFSLMGIYFLILSIKNKINYYWILFPVIFGFAFLSKQVPASYVIICISIILIYYSLVNKQYQWIKYSFIGTLLFILSMFFIGSIQGISLTSFLEQYIFYPQTVGKQRYSDFNITFHGAVSHFKFIYIALIPLVYINVRNLFNIKNYFKNENFIFFLILTTFTFTLIFHQIFTRNQTFIFFLIPLLTAFLHIHLNSNKKIISLFLVLFCFVITTKYHLRFNENRKFHELNNSNFELSLNAKKIDEKLSGLKWITPKYNNNPEKEIDLINEVIVFLNNDSRTKMLLTNYSFFSTILENKFYSTTRWHISDDTDYPETDSNYFLSYKNFILKKIKDNKIKVIYLIEPVKKSNLYDYVNKECFEEKEITQILTSFSLINCKEING